MHVWNEEEACGLTDEERRVSRRLLTEEARGSVRRRAPWAWVLVGVMVGGFVLAAMVEVLAR